MVEKIKKRNGDIVDFNPEKIAIVVGKAFNAVRGGIEPERLERITGAVLEDVERLFVDEIPSVEQVQDLVERSIMTEGFYDVAKAYIVYRYEHAKIREEEKKTTLEKIERNDLFVTKRSGEKERFSVEKMRATLERAARGYETAVNIDTLIEQTSFDLYEGISTKEIARTLMMTVRAFIEQDPAYSKVAARLLLGILYKEVVGADTIDFNNLDRHYREAFIRNIKKGVEIGRLDPRMLVFDLETLAEALKPEQDELLLYLGVQVLYDRYFLRDPAEKAVLETPQAFWMRVAMGLALLEEKKIEYAVTFYETLSSLRFVSSTPTLFHAGLTRPQLSSCFINTVPDDLTGIFKSYADNAQLLKWSGGMGTDWTDVRATGALIKGIGVESQGVIPFLKIANDTTISINRSGRRRGAACVYLEMWHHDIEDFMELRKNTGDERRRTHDMDTAAWIPDLFMKRVRDDRDWTLFSPDETPDLHHLYGKRFEERYASYEEMARKGELKLTKTVRARDLWKKMLAMLFETGHPWVTFKDPSNIRSPQDHVGVVHSSNLCTEITLNTSPEETAVCNLGSVNLAKHVSGNQFDRGLLEATVSTAMRMLDNVIDLNFYPTPEARHSNMKHRPVGLGIMGFQDALYALDINFDSEECVGFADRSMEAVAYYAIRTSVLLAKERGSYPTYKGSKWDRGILPLDTLDILERERGEAIDVPRTSRMDWNEIRMLMKEYGMRNSNTLAIAPTATISNIAGTSPSIEPIYKNLYVKANMSGDFTVINPALIDDLKKLNLWDYEMLGKIKYHDGSVHAISEIPERIRAKYKEAFEIHPRWLIKAAAYRGKWIDQSQSLNLFFVGSSGKDVSEMYLYAWSLGLKTTYYLRTLAASQVEKSTLSPTEFGETHNRKSSKDRESGKTLREDVTARSGGTDDHREDLIAAISSIPIEIGVEVPLRGTRSMGNADETIQDKVFFGIKTQAEGVRESTRYHDVAVAIPPVITRDPPPPLVIIAETPQSLPPSLGFAAPAKNLEASSPKLCRLDDPDCEACQ